MPMPVGQSPLIILIGEYEFALVLSKYSYLYFMLHFSSLTVSLRNSCYRYVILAADGAIQCCFLKN